MADSKITALTSIGASTDPANDPLVLVDVSDTSMAATGTTKKVTLNQLLGASGTATLASATITGDLTVDTNTLKVDSVNNRVGIGTASPAYPLDVNGAIQTTSGSAAGLFQWAYGASASSRSWRAWNDVSANGDFQISTSTTRTGSTYSDRYRIDVSGVHEWSNTSGLAMTLNSTGLGVGGSPNDKLEVVGSGSAGIRVSRAGVSSQYTTLSAGATGPSLDASSAIGALTFGIGGSTKMTVDSSGNVGIGVTPSAWRAGARALQLGANKYASLHEQSSGAVNLCFAAYEGSANVFNYTTGDAASRYALINGQHQWYNAPSGTAGTAITFTQAMTLDASGNLLVGTTTAGAKITALAGASGQAAIFQQPAQNFWCVLAHNQATSGDNSFVLFGTEASFTSRGSITYNRAAGQVSYNITSDYRLKEDVKPLTGALNRISSLKPSTYKFKETGFTCEGFIAHELAEVIPAAVTGEKDAVNEDGSIKAQGVDLSKVVPVLVAAIQELTARVQTLETR